MRTLVVNAGSSSLKLSVVVGGADIAASENLPADGRPDDELVRQTIETQGRIDAVGHRIVHGGVDFTGPVRLDRTVVERLRELSDLAPLHQAKSLHGVDVVARVLPGVPAVGCFDTAFHANMPRAASTYALPAAWRARWGVRRFGFHGLSHAWASHRCATLMRQPLESMRVVTCHLGAGASLCAVREGCSVDTTMGFTPLEGLVMATRSGSVDPGLVLWLLEHEHIAAAELSAVLDRRSGLLGLGGSADMRAVLEAEVRGDDAAALAIEVYVHRLREGIASMAAAMGGTDAGVFTGGVGERSPLIRDRACAGLGFLGVRLDADRNERTQSDAEIGSGDAPTRVFVVTAHEDLQIAREVESLLTPTA